MTTTVPDRKQDLCQMSQSLPVTPLIEPKKRIVLQILTSPEGQTGLAIDCFHSCICALMGNQLVLWLGTKPWRTRATASSHRIGMSIRQQEQCHLWLRLRLFLLPSRYVRTIPREESHRTGLLALPLLTDCPLKDNLFCTEAVWTARSLRLPPLHMHTFPCASDKGKNLRKLLLDIPGKVGHVGTKIAKQMGKRWAWSVLCIVLILCTTGHRRREDHVSSRSCRGRYGKRGESTASDTHGHHLV